MHLCLLVQVVDPAQYKTLSCFYHSVQGLLCLNDFVYLQLTPAILGCSGYCCRWISDHLVRGPTCFDFHVPAQHCEGTTLHLLLLRKVSDLPQEWTSSKLGCLLVFFNSDLLKGQSAFACGRIGRVRPHHHGVVAQSWLERK